MEMKCNIKLQQHAMTHAQTGVVSKETVKFDANTASEARRRKH